MLRTNRLNKRKAFMMKLFWLAKVRKKDWHSLWKKDNIPTQSEQNFSKKRQP